MVYIFYIHVLLHRRPLYDGRNHVCCCFLPWVKRRRKREANANIASIRVLFFESITPPEILVFADVQWFAQVQDIIASQLCVVGGKTFFSLSWVFFHQEKQLCDILSYYVKDKSRPIFFFCHLIYGYLGSKHAWVFPSWVQRVRQSIQGIFCKREKGKLVHSGLNKLHWIWGKFWKGGDLYKT